MKTLIIHLILLFAVSIAQGQTRYKHVLITNDDGIEDADRLLALANSVAKVADRVSVVVSAFDRSGTSNHSLYGKYQSTFEVTCKYLDKDNNITAYALPANPSDCVILGLCGFFGDDTPNLVLSGINSGPNIGPDWFGSGTIGAARTAAFYGVPAIAFSGFDDSNEKSFSVIPLWIREFISSGFMDDMNEQSYLTVAFPRIPFEQVKGIRLAERKISLDKSLRVNLKKLHGKESHVPNNKTIWTLEHTGRPDNGNAKYDDTMLRLDYIIITPMTIDENDRNLMQNMQSRANLIPEFNK